MNVLGTTLIHVLLLSSSLMAEENPADDDDPETFPERLRSEMLRAAWQSEPIPVVPLPQGVEGQVGNHPQPGLPPPPPPDDVDDDVDDRQPPPPPPIPPPPTEEESTVEPDTNVGGNYWYYTDTQQPESTTPASNWWYTTRQPSTQQTVPSYNWWSYNTRQPTTQQTVPSYNWWSYTTRKPYVETTTQPANNYWYNYYTTRKPTTFSWVNWNSFTSPPTTMNYYWQAPAAGPSEDLTVTDSTINQNFDAVSTEEATVSPASKLKPMTLQPNISFNSNSKFTRPSKESWKFWDNNPPSTSKYSWYSSGDEGSSSAEFPWKHVNVPISSLSKKTIDTHKLNTWSSEIVTNAPEISSLHTGSEILLSVSTNGTSLPSELSAEATIRPQSTWIESKSNVTHSEFNRSYIWNVISTSRPNITYNWNENNSLPPERRPELQEILPDFMKNDATGSEISDKLLEKVNYSVISQGTAIVTSDQNRLNNSRNEPNKFERLPWKYLYNTGVSQPTVKYDKETTRLSLENQNVTAKTQEVFAPKWNVPKQSININSSVTRYDFKTWTFWENSGRSQPNFRYYWYTTGDHSIQEKLKSAEKSLEQPSKQTAYKIETVSPLGNIFSAKSEASVGLQNSKWRESKIQSEFPKEKYGENSNEQAGTLKYVNTDSLSEKKQTSTVISEKTIYEFQNKTSGSEKSESEMKIRPQYLGLDSKFNKTHNSPGPWNFWNSTWRLQPKISYKWYSTGDMSSSDVNYNKSNVFGELNTFPSHESVSDSARRETNIKYQSGSPPQFIRNNTSNTEPKFWYGKHNVSNELVVAPQNKSNEDVSKENLISEANYTTITLAKFNSVNYEGDNLSHHQFDNYSSTLNATKSPVGSWTFWNTSGKSPGSYRYTLESPNGSALNLSAERSKTTEELETDHTRTVTPNSELIKGESAKEAKLRFNNIGLNSELTSVRSTLVSESSKSQPAYRYFWYSPEDEFHNVNLKSLATSDKLLKISPKYIHQGQKTNIFETTSEKHEVLQQQYDSSGSKTESMSYAPSTSKDLFTSSDSQSSDQSSGGSFEDPRGSEVSSALENVHSSPVLVTSDETVHHLNTGSNSSHISFSSWNTTSRPQTRYHWYGVDEVFRKDSWRKATDRK